MKTVRRVRLKQVCDGRIRFAVERISRPREVYDAVMPYYKGADREILSVLCLDAQNQPNSFNIASIGALNTTRTRPAEILKAAILSNALGRSGRASWSESISTIT
jgi:DNA repair protein RadC